MSPSLCHALVLTAGLGTRLRPLTDVRAKPAIPVAGEPIVRRIIAWLAANGLVDLVLNLHHRPNTVTAVVGDGNDLGVGVRYSWEQPVVLGTGGGPRQALPIIGAETFLIVNGDTLTDLDVRPFAAAHAASGALVTLALVPNREPRRYGGVRLDHDHRVTGFVARGPAAQRSYHFIGVQVAHADAFRSLPAGMPVNSIGGAYDALVATRPGSIRGYLCDAAFWDIGTPLDYWNTSLALLGSDGDDPAARGRGVRIDRSARVTRSILWDDIEVGPNCTLDECIVADGVRIPAGARYRRVVLVAANDGGLRASPLAG